MQQYSHAAIQPCSNTAMQQYSHAAILRTAMHATLLPPISSTICSWVISTYCTIDYYYYLLRSNTTIHLGLRRGTFTFTFTFTATATAIVLA
jgi:hypothetical protein